jgi:hypothetical protein
MGSQELFLGADLEKARIIDMNHQFLTDKAYS